MENQKKNEYDIQAAKSLGDELGQLRHKSGWDIDEVARRLKLSAEQIEALEKGDYSFFSGLVFVMGYLRSYARLLKIDEATITGRLKAISAPEEDHVYLVDRKQNAGLNYQDGEKVGFPKWVLGMAALILLGGGIYVWQSKSNHENEQQVAQNSDAVRNSMQTPDLKKKMLPFPIWQKTANKKYPMPKKQLQVSPHPKQRHPHLKSKSIQTSFGLKSNTEAI